MTIVVNEGEGNIIKLIRGISIRTQRVHRISWAHHYFLFSLSNNLAHCWIVGMNVECVRVCMHSYYAKHKITTFLSLSALHLLLLHILQKTEWWWAGVDLDELIYHLIFMHGMTKLSIQDCLPTCRTQTIFPSGFCFSACYVVVKLLYMLTAL